MARKHLRWPTAAFALILAALPLSGRAEPLACDDPAFRVEAPDAATRRQICAAATHAAHTLGTCGLVPLHPVMIETVDSLIHDIGACLAAYDCTRHTIRIIHPTLLRDHLPPDDAYALLPDREVFRALIAHELAHALVHQASGDRAIALVDHEYIANAMELAALPPHHRETLLAASGLEPPVSAGVIDLFIYGLAPRRFAAAAWLHFDEHGCGTISGILDGSVTFRVRN